MLRRVRHEYVYMFVCKKTVSKTTKFVDPTTMTTTTLHNPRAHLNANAYRLVVIIRFCLRLPSRVGHTHTHKHTTTTALQTCTSKPKLVFCVSKSATSDNRCDRRTYVHSFIRMPFRVVAHGQRQRMCSKRCFTSKFHSDARRQRRRCHSLPPLTTTTMTQYLVYANAYLIVHICIHMYTYNQ